TESVPDKKAALDGARDILSQTFSENASLLGKLRAYMGERAIVAAKLVEGKAEEGAKFADYFDYSERWAAVPAHRALAMLRGRSEGVLSMDILVDADDAAPIKPAERMVAEEFDIPLQGANANAWLLSVARWTWRV